MKNLGARSTIYRSGRWHKIIPEQLKGTICIAFSVTYTPVGLYGTRDLAICFVSCDGSFQVENKIDSIVASDI